MSPSQSPSIRHGVSPPGVSHGVAPQPHRGPVGGEGGVGNHPGRGQGEAREEDDELRKKNVSLIGDQKYSHKKYVLRKISPPKKFRNANQYLTRTTGT